MSFDPLPSINVPEIELFGQFYTSQSPVQAWGTVRGREFYFRSRHEHWDFAVSETPDVDPGDIFPDDNRARMFVREGPYGQGKFAASYMPLDVAAQIIERCAQEYAQTLA